MHYSKRIQKSLDENDDKLFDAAEKASLNLSSIDTLMDDLSLGKFENIDTFKKEVERHIDSFIGFQAHLKKENFYKVKALWLLGLTFYEQSQLSKFLEAQKASSIPELMLIEERRLNSVVFEEFSPDLAFALTKREENEKQFQQGAEELSYSNWILFSEDNALRIFDDIIPKYLSSTSFYLGASKSLERFQREGLYLFLSEAKLISGNVYLNRALNQLSPSTGFEPNEKLGREFLDQAIQSLLEYVELIAPKGKLLNFSDIEGGMNQESPFPFLHNKRVSDRLSEAQVLLSECYLLKKDYQNSIATLKTFLNNIIEKDPIYKKSRKESKNYIGSSYPVPNENFNYQVGLDPFYTSLLSINPHSQEALFLLGFNYQKIAERELSKIRRLSHEEGARYEKTKTRLDQYSRQALAYYSQLINSQIYSPLRKTAILQRAQVWNLLDNYPSARSDLIALLDVPRETPSTASAQELRFIKDIPELQYPNRSLVYMELGKLYFENRDYEAASESFKEAASQENDNNGKVYEAKAAFAHTLYARKEWIKAAYLLSGKGVCR